MLESERDSVVIRQADRPGDLGWVVMAHGEQYAAEFGWNSEFEALVARIVADFAADHDPTRERAWLAEINGHRVGCVFCVRKDDATAQLRILLVSIAGRGRGLGRRLIDECIDFARAAGYRRMVLWTNDPLAAARHFTLLPDSPSSTSRHTTASVSTSSGRTTNSTWP